MARKNITNEKIAKALNLNVSTICAKLNSINRLKYIEAKKIQTIFFPDLSTEYLFEIEEEKSKKYIWKNQNIRN